MLLYVHYTIVGLGRVQCLNILFFFLLSRIWYSSVRSLRFCLIRKMKINELFIITPSETELNQQWIPFIITLLNLVYNYTLPHEHLSYQKNYKYILLNIFFVSKILVRIRFIIILFTLIYIFLTGDILQWEKNDFITIK